MMVKMNKIYLKMLLTLSKVWAKWDLLKKSADQSTNESNNSTYKNSQVKCKCYIINYLEFKNNVHKKHYPKDKKETTSKRNKVYRVQTRWK